MTQIKNLSNEQIDNVFSTLGLGETEEVFKYLPYNAVAPSVPTKQLVLPKLSDSSVPLPSGSITDAHLEKPSR